MIRFLLHKLRQAPGPLKQTRLIAGDLAEEILDLAEHYLSRDDEVGDPIHTVQPAAEKQEEPPARDRDSEEPARVQKQARQAKGSKTAVPSPTPTRTLDVPPELARVLDVPQNRKKQKFKVLAILWDARRRDLGPLSAKEVSEHGVKLGLAIRHENVRKVIRMRLEKLVEIRTEQVGSTSIYRYRLSDDGNADFRANYLD